jgi:hypothetical protein
LGVLSAGPKRSLLAALAAAELDVRFVRPVRVG